MDDQKRRSPTQDRTVTDPVRNSDEHKREDRPTEREEDSLDRTIEDSFPASDPPSSIPDPDEDAA